MRKACRRRFWLRRVRCRNTLLALVSLTGQSQPGSKMVRGLELSQVIALLGHERQPGQIANAGDCG
jgi:hypothetical protein